MSSFIAISITRSFILQALVFQLVVIGASASRADTSGVLLSLTPQSASYDFGKVDQTSAAPITHQFLLKNDNNTAVTVESLLVSCGCTTAVLGGGASLPDTLAPGQELEVDTSIDPARLYVGPANKTVTVYFHGQTTPAATLVITGTVTPAAVFSVGFINFGNVAYGDDADQMLTATIDKAMVPSADVLQFESSDSDISGEKVSVIEAGPNEETVVYKLNLSKSPYLGLIKANVSLMVPNSTNGLSVIGVPIPVQGDVIGEYSSAPQSVSFNGVVAGTPSTREVQLNGISARDISKIKLVSASPVIDLKIEPPKTNAPTVNVLTLDVTLNGKMPVGALQTQAIVTFPDGERLMLPIFVYTVAASG